MKRGTAWIATGLAAGLAMGCAETPTALDQDQELPEVAFSHRGRGGSSIDQSQPMADPGAGFTTAIGGNSNQLVAQLFTSGVTGKMRELEVPVACADGMLVAEIRDVVAGLPGTMVIRSETFDPSDLTTFIPGVATFSVLPFRPSPDLVAGTQYAMVFDNPTGSCGMLPGPLGDPYAGGDGYAFDDVNGQWVPIELGTGRFDIPFYTYVR